MTTASTTVVLSVRPSETLDREMFTFLQKQGPQSPYTLAKQFKLGRGTVYEAINRLENTHLVERSTLLTGAVGRPSVVVRVCNLHHAANLENTLARERQAYRSCITCDHSSHPHHLPCRRCMRHPQMKDHYTPR